MSADRLDVVAASVIRVAPEGFASPYVLAAVRDGDRLSLVRLVGATDIAPPPGSVVHRGLGQDGTPVYELVDG